MALKTTKFMFFKNTPLTDFVNTIHFDTIEERDAFFLYGNHYPTMNTEQREFNFLRDRSTVTVSADNYFDWVGVNYCTFFSGFDNRRYYAFVVDVKYDNSSVRLTLVIDVVMTFTQGKTLETIDNLIIQREHLSRSDYKKFLPIIRTNSDIIESTTKRYVFNDLKRFASPFVVFQSAVDLSADFGSEKKPKVVTSDGGVFDDLVSPVNLYALELNRFRGLMEILKEYSWIAQNISLVMVVPLEFLEADMLEDVSLKDPHSYTIKKFKDGGHSDEKTLNELHYPIAKLLEFYGINGVDEKHLLRDGYCTLEMYSWDGQSVLLNPAFLNDDTGLHLHAKAVYGYQNELRIFPLNYQTSDDEEDFEKSGKKLIYKGTFLNNAFVFNEFTQLPLLIDNFQLGKARNANQRELAESKLVTNRIKDTFTDKTSIQDKFYNAASVLSDLTPKGILGKMTDEYEFYRSQKAQFADMQLNTPTITAQTKGNAFQLANDIFGITLKLSAPTSEEWDKIRRYYQALGYELNLNGERLSNVHSMSVCNYIQFTGNFVLPYVPIEYISMLKPLFENGVRFWHNDGSPNPMQNPILNNKIIA